MKRTAAMNLAFGLLMALIGMVMLGTGVYWIIDNADSVAVALSANNEPVGGSYTASSSCASRLGSIGLSAAPSADQVLVTLDDVVDPEKATALASLALYVCGDHAMEYFCMGGGCDAPMAMRLGIRGAQL